ncbi:CopG family transcriptional regulator [Deltaproteobacteria bacterium TL4]
MSAQMIIRIDPELKNKVNQFAKAEGKNTSEVVRSLLEGYVQDRDVGGYVSNLWERIGNKLFDKQVTLNEIPQIIKDVRSKN